MTWRVALYSTVTEMNATKLMLVNSHTGCHTGQLCIHAPMEDHDQEKK